MQQNKPPLVSIIIPSFNQGAFIERTINSILIQTHSPIEIIVIDGGSTDNTICILKKFGGKIKWKSGLDRGPADAVNKGFEIVKGEIIGWINSDDVYFNRNTISDIVNNFQRNIDTDIIYGDAAIISEDDLLLRLWLLPPYDKNRIIRRNMIVQPSVFFKKSVIKNNKLTVGCLPLDYELWLRLGSLGYNFLHIPNIVACDRCQPNRLSVIRRSELNDSKELIRANYLKSKKSRILFYILDRSAQLICRLKGALIITNLFIVKKVDFAFPLKIDSYRKLILRQLFHSVIFDEEL